MLERGNGVLLLTTGGSAVYPNPIMGNVGIAMAGLRTGQLFGQRVFRSLAEVDVPVDVVDMLRPADEASEIARQAIAIGAAAGIFSKKSSPRQPRPSSRTRCAPFPCGPTNQVLCL
jgi:CoA binding domain